MGVGDTDDYVYDPPVYNLVWADGPRAGLRVVARSVNLTQYAAISQLADFDPGGKVDPKQVTDLCDAFALALVSWNLKARQADGTLLPVPADQDGLATLDFPFLLEILNQWMDAISGVSTPLGKPSTDGALEASLPMEVLPSSP